AIRPPTIAWSCVSSLEKRENRLGCAACLGWLRFGIRSGVPAQGHGHVRKHSSGIGATPPDQTHRALCKTEFIRPHQIDAQPPCDPAIARKNRSYITPGSGIGSGSGGSFSSCSSTSSGKVSPSSSSVSLSASSRSFRGDSSAILGSGGSLGKAV